MGQPPGQTCVSQLRGVDASTASESLGKDKKAQAPAESPGRSCPVSLGCTHALLAGLGDELALAVDAGVGALAGDALLPLGDVPGRGRAPARVLGACDKDSTHTAAG